MKKISAVRISKLEFQIASLKKARKSQRKALSKLNKRLYHINYYLGHTGKWRDRKLVTRMERAEKRLKKAIKPWNVRKPITQFESYVKLSMSKNNRLNRLLGMPKKSWKTFRALFLKEGK